MSTQRFPTITAYTMTNALGVGCDRSLAALQAGTSGLAHSGRFGIELDTFLGQVEGVDAVTFPDSLQGYDCCNNRLALLPLRADGFITAARGAVARYGADRVGLFLGTSTSGIAETERAYAEQGDAAQPRNIRFHGTHSLASLAEVSAATLGVTGATQTVSTACSSSAKVFGVAQRYMNCGLCDAAIVGGVDSLCATTLYGFNALELISRRPCRPWGSDRDGVSIGEAAGFALLEPGADGIRLLGCGESNDAYHMSSPHPRGRGPAGAVRDALGAAGLGPEAIGYVNLHGTGTPANDASEDRAITSVFGPRTWCSSTKRLTGHTLGAAGITEALFCCLAVEHGFVPGGETDGPLDQRLEARFAVRSQTVTVDRAVSLSLGFGGSNCCVVIGAPP